MRNKSRGVTLIETLAAIAVLAATFYLGKQGMGFIGGIFNQKGHIDIQQEAQRVLYDIVRTTRNSSEIVDASSSTLVVRVFDTKTYDFDDPQLYDVTNVGTVTYSFVPSTATFDGRSYLLETRKFPGRDPWTRELFVDMIKEPVLDEDYIFRPEPFGDPPYEYVRINFHLTPKFMVGKKTDKKHFTFSALSMKRARTL